jgi:hypothetical protein
MAETASSSRAIFSVRFGVARRLSAWDVLSRGHFE